MQDACIAEYSFKGGFLLHTKFFHVFADDKTCEFGHCVFQGLKIGAGVE